MRCIALHARPLPFDDSFIVPYPLNAMLISEEQLWGKSMQKCPSDDPKHRTMMMVHKVVTKSGLFIQLQWGKELPCCLVMHCVLAADMEIKPRGVEVGA